MLEKFDKQYLCMAQILSENSYAKRLKVGATWIKLSCNEKDRL